MTFAVRVCKDCGGDLTVAIEVSDPVRIRFHSLSFLPARGLCSLIPCLRLGLAALAFTHAAHLFARYIISKLV